MPCFAACKCGGSCPDSVLREGGKRGWAVIADWLPLPGGHQPWGHHHHLGVIWEKPGVPEGTLLVTGPGCPVGLCGSVLSEKARKLLRWRPGVSHGAR